MNSVLQNLKTLVLGAAAALLLKLLYPTYRWKIIGIGDDSPDWPAREPRIVAFWHGHQLLMPWLYQYYRKEFGRGMTVLISEHRDGRIIANAMTAFGIRSVAGSSTRGGKEALFKLIDLLRQGEHVSITPDGPKGPLHKAKAGIIRIAQRSRAGIYPMAVAADRAWRSRSWDGMFLPKPFAKVAIVVGASLTVPAEMSQLDVNALCAELENLLRTATEKAEQAVS